MRYLPVIVGAHAGLLGSSLPDPVTGSRIVGETDSGVVVATVWGEQSASKAANEPGDALVVGTEYSLDDDQHLTDARPGLELRSRVAYFRCVSSPLPHDDLQDVCQAVMGAHPPDRESLQNGS
jgi:hypothetical protein